LDISPRTINRTICGTAETGPGPHANRAGDPRRFLAQSRTGGIGDSETSSWLYLGRFVYSFENFNAEIADSATPVENGVEGQVPRETVFLQALRSKALSFPYEFSYH